jgi:hypothetical protein
MNLIKKLLIFPCLLFFINCGFIPIYSLENKKELQIGITKLTISGDAQMNRNSERQIQPYKNTSDKTILIELDVSNNFTKETALRDLKGGASQYLITMTSSLEYRYNDNPLLNDEGEEINRGRSFSRKFNYRNVDNQFDLRRYEESIKRNLMNQINKDIILYLSNIK